jgi:hypothetical protein
LSEAVKCPETGDAGIMMIEFFQDHALLGWVHTDDRGHGGDRARIAQQLIEINVQLASQTPRKPRQLSGRRLF